ncbi:unnamed protein product [Adineta ricciae]|uniref:Uncharacterized protein n=1 Tax=Adineta ricciae TaxID=249248 RepID=A0A814SR92_ADIRI|nr:unnamed protein product [Adineta ricciae]CAF1282250.1 unnamed protein product [Adineta ricciae]
MAESSSAILQNTGNCNSTIRQVLVDVEHLMDMLQTELHQTKSSKISESLSSSITMTNVTITDENDHHQLIEHLRHRILQLEHERNVLLTSYELLIKLLK